MFSYRLYRFDRAGHITSPPQILQCSDDDAALVEAQKYLDGHALEIWREDMRIGRLPERDAKPKS